MVPLREGNEARRDGRRGVGVSHSTAEAGELSPRDPVEGRGHRQVAPLEGKTANTPRLGPVSTSRQRIAELARQALGMAVAIAWLPGPAGTRRRVAKLSVEEPDAAEPARPDLWRARVSNDPGLPDHRLQRRPRPNCRERAQVQRDPDHRPQYDDRRGGGTHRWSLGTRRRSPLSVGEPQTYGRGEAEDQRLFGQHDVRWVPEGMPGSGRLTLFNNRISGPDGDHSAVFEFVPPTDETGRYVLPNGEAFGPQELVWSYMAPDRVSFHSFFISGAHRLPERPYVHHGGCAGALLRGDSRGGHRVGVLDALLRTSDRQSGRASQSLRSVSGDENLAGSSGARGSRPTTCRAPATTRASA